MPPVNNRDRILHCAAAAATLPSGSSAVAADVALFCSTQFESMYVEGCSMLLHAILRQATLVQYTM